MRQELQAGASTTDAFLDAATLPVLSEDDGELDPFDPGELDALVADLEPLDELESRVQEANASGRFLCTLRSELRLERFRPPSGGTWHQKPAPGALFTVPDLGLPSLWEGYLRRTLSSREPIPPTWKVRTAPAVPSLRVDSVAAWRDFVVRFGIRRGDVLTVDWVRVAATYPLVHIGARVCVAGDGIWLRADTSRVAPCHWSVPTTVITDWDEARVTVLPVTEAGA